MNYQQEGLQSQTEVSNEHYQDYKSAATDPRYLQDLQSHHNASSSHFSQPLQSSQSRPLYSRSQDNIQPMDGVDAESYSPLNLKHTSLEEMTITPQNKFYMTDNQCEDGIVKSKETSEHKNTRPLRAAIPQQLVMPNHSSFHGMMTGEQADQILMTNRSERCYLTRYSRNQQSYVLSVKVPNLDQPLHYKLNINNDARRYEIDGTHVMFESLDSLLSNYENNSVDGFVHSIGSPCVYRNVPRRHSMYVGSNSDSSATVLADIIRSQQEQHTVMMRNYSDLMQNQQTFFQEMFQVLRATQQQNQVIAAESRASNQERPERRGYIAGQTERVQGTGIVDEGNGGEVVEREEVEDVATRRNGQRVREDEGGNAARGEPREAGNRQPQNDNGNKGKGKCIIL